MAVEIWLAEDAIKIEAAAPGLPDASLATRGLFRRCLISDAGKFRRTAAEARRGNWRGNFRRDGARSEGPYVTYS